MKALSIRQPWAHAILHLGKDVENRDWCRKNMIGETIAIHAAAGMSFAEYEDCYYFIRDRFGAEIATQLPAEKLLERGSIVGTARIRGIITQKQVDKGLPVSKWFVGEYGFYLSNVVALATPIPIKGKLMFWDVPNLIVEQIRDAGGTR